ncbi:hypothetical protein EXIGLDRAFT_775846 [Exidia glandulosa HHB12029]|uniref:SnoaL-like domain-containing protein n=1 Tax=Exidia glandulosa HHB12029 TaxID=1314781 RepID=A0A165DQX1_EXIGL|nr:hypothetical protein EXIGLDRAFT_775846 [Exidia glandulosa HHB12029]
MSSEDIKNWTQQRLEAVFTANSDDSWNDAYSAAFAPDLALRIANLGEGMLTTEDDLPEHIIAGEGQRAESHSGDDARQAFTARMKAAATTQGSKVQWNNINVQQGSTGTTIVEGTCTVTRSLIFRIRVTPAQVKLDVHFRAEIADTAFPKIVRYAQTVRSYRPPINLPHLPVQPRPKKMEL